MPFKTSDGGDALVWDCVVVGGGAAGLSAALVLGRARQHTLVVDAGAQSNLSAHGIGGLLGHDGRAPLELYADGRKELAAYPTVELRSGEVVRGRRDDAGLLLDLADGSQVHTKRVLLATGMDYDRPRLEGVAERWGRSVFHCPFCHGWEVRDQALAVFDGAPSGVQRALLLRTWSDDVTLLTDGPAGLDDEQRERLRAAGVPVDERRVARLLGPDDALSAVAFDDGTELACDALLVAVTLRQRSPLAEQLGAVTAEPTALAADAVQIDETFSTSAPGVHAAGDLTGHMPSLANAIAAGSSAASMIVHGLVAERSSSAGTVPAASSSKRSPS